MTRNTSLRVVLFAVLASALLVTAMPVSAADGKLLEKWTTDSDFSGYSQLGSMEIDGTGSAAHIQQKDWSDPSVEGWEDGVTGTSNYWDDSEVTLSTTSPISGSYSGRLQASGSFSGDDAIIYFNQKAGKPSSIDIDVEPDTLSKSNDYVVVEAESSSGTNWGAVRFYGDGSFDIEDDQGNSVGGGSWLNDETVRVQMLSGNDVYIAVLGEDSATYDVGSHPGGMARLRLRTFGTDSGSSQDVYYDNMEATSFQGGDEPYVFNLGRADGDLVAYNYSGGNDARVVLEAYDGSWSTVNSSTATSSGEYTMTYDSDLYSSTRVRVNMTEGQVDDFSIYEQGRPPEVEHVSPADGKQLGYDSDDLNFTANVTDPDFANSDSVTLELRDDADDSVLASTTVTTNGTATVGGVSVGGGETLNYWWSVSDSTGFSNATGNFSISTPATRPPSVSLSTPADGSTTTTESITLEASLSDGDYAIGNRTDTLTAEFRHTSNDSVIGTDSVTANGTASTSYNVGVDETLSWYVYVNDSYGNAAASANWTVSGNGSDPPSVVQTYPADSSSQEGLSVNITASIDDPDFNSDWGDSVTATFRESDGTTIGTDSRSSAGNVTVEWSDLEGGSNEWYVELEDQYGNTAQSANQTVNAPDTLSVYNETNATQKLTGVNVTLEFYFDRDGEPDLIVERETSNGEINMTGLPVDEDFVIVASSDGYFNRRIWVPSLFETQRVYLLNENETAVQPTFRLVDFTGEYERETTVIEVQRNINGTWRTVEGDFFGAANSMAAQLAFNERHRIVITNTATGATRELGSFTPTATATVELEVHNDDEIVNERFAPTAAFDPDVGSLPAASSDVSVDVGPGGKTLVTYYFSARLENGTELFNTSGSSADGETLESTIGLAGAEDQNVTLYLNWTAADGDTGSESRVYTVRESFDNQYALLPTLLNADVGGETPNTLTSLLVVLAALLATGYAATEMGSGPAGLVGLGVVAMGALVDFVPFGWLVAGSIAWLVMAGVRNRL
jgi:hypothetical protein